VSLAATIDFGRKRTDTSAAVIRGRDWTEPEQMGLWSGTGRRKLRWSAGFQLIVPSIPNASAMTYPTIMVPAFGVPSSILLHFLSLRQLYRPIKPRA
jgi:hypothetical protein